MFAAEAAGCGAVAERGGHDFLESLISWSGFMP
jgi:hypothetical protein